ESRAIEPALQLGPTAVPGARRLVPLTRIDVRISGVLEREVDDLLLDVAHLRQDDLRVRLDRAELPLAERLRLPQGVREEGARNRGAREHLLLLARARVGAVLIELVRDDVGPAPRRLGVAIPVGGRDRVAL